MLKIFLVAFIIVILSSGVGSFIYKAFGIKENDFYAPVGLAAIFCALQLLYYPIQFFNSNFIYIILISSIILLLCIFITIKNIKLVFKNLFNAKSLVVLVSLTLFCVVFYQCFIDIEFSDSPMYLNYIAQNINNEHLNLFNLYSGLVGGEWDGLYLYQGYYHFASFLCWLINVPYYLFGAAGYVENIAISTWGLGMIYSMISSMVIIDIVKYFKIKNRLLAFSILVFTLFFSNFYYWRVVFAFYGNTYRTMWITLLMFFIYRWLKSNNDKLKYVLMIIVGSGLACSSSFLFISFSVLFCLSVYLFYIKKENCFKDLALIVLPIVVYASIMIYKSNHIVGLILALLFILYYSLNNLSFITNIIHEIEKFLFRYGKIIFFVMIPIGLMLYSWYINVYEPEYLIDYSYVLQDHQQYDMVKDYTFRYAGIVDNILNVVRWLGVIFIIWKAKTVEDSYIKITFILMIILFLNPLCATALAKTIASNVFYRNVEVLFNPFTETLIIIYIVKCWDNKIANILLSCILLVSTVLGHVLSYIDNDDGLYTFYINGGKDINSIYKIEQGEYEVIKILQQELSDFDEEGQPVVISQANGLRTFLPNVYQPITARDYYYPYNRLDWNFYEIVRKHYPWEEKVDTPYENTCMYLDRYDVDYIIVKYWENPEFDQASDACAVTIFEGAEFKLKKVDR